MLHKFPDQGEFGARIPDRRTGLSRQFDSGDDVAVGELCRIAALESTRPPDGPHGEEPRSGVSNHGSIHEAILRDGADAPPQDEESFLCCFKQPSSSRLKLCIRCTSRRFRIQWRECIVNMRAAHDRRYPHRRSLGFEPHFRKSPLTDPWEPLYSRRTDKAVIMGLRLAKPHTNARGLIHGGLIAALSDNAMGHSCAHVMGNVSSLVTIGLRSISSAPRRSGNGFRSRPM